MARGGAIKGEASTPLPERTPARWTCTGCGKEIEVLIPAAQESYKHSTCPERAGGEYRP